MPRKKLYKESDYIQIVLPKKDKIAFDAWCEANNVTMSEVIRAQIAGYVIQGEKLILAKNEVSDAQSIQSQQ
jgi:hypothetical protein